MKYAIATIALVMGVGLMGATQATPAAAPHPDAVIHIKQFAYAPSARTIKVGQTVQWVNDDEVAHSVTADDRSFDSRELSKGQTWSHTFDKAGTYTYYCDDHEFMKGSVIVK